MVCPSGSKTYGAIIALAIAWSLCPSQASAMGADYPAGTLASIGGGGGPALLELVNTGDRVGGYWLNQSDWFFFRGDAEALNKFFHRYGLIPGTPLAVIVHAGERPLTGKLGDKEPSTPYDWTLSIVRRGWGVPRDPRLPKDRPGYVVTVNIWLSDEITLDRLQIPAHVDVKSAGDIESFIKRHREADWRRALSEQASAKPALPSPLINPRLTRTRVVSSSHQVD